MTPSMTGKTVLVTGGTGGIGRATATALANLGAHVVITGRNETRAQEAAAEIRAATGNAGVDALAADLSEQAEIRRLAAEVLARYARLDVLINNVGGSWAHRKLTSDGLEYTFAVNHLAAFLLTDLLLERLKASAPSRVITVSSNAQAMGKIKFDDLQGEHGFSSQKAYPQSKLANVMFTYELARRLQGSGVTANALHPGVVRTAFGSEDPTGLFKVVVPFARPFMKTPERGAQTSVYLASSPEVEGVTGKYFSNCKPKSSNKSSYDRVAAAQLWDVSAELVGLSTGES